MANTTTLTPSSKSAVTASSRASTRLTGLIAANFMVSAVLRHCHSEERSDEESVFPDKSRSFGALRMTLPRAASLLLAGGKEPIGGEREELVRVDRHAPELPVLSGVVGGRTGECV